MLLPIPSPFPIDAAEMRAIGQRLATHLQPWRLASNTVFCHTVTPVYYGRQRTTDRHSHPHYEGFILLDGSVELMTPWETVSLKPGHTLLFSPNTIYQWQTHDDPCLFMMCAFDLEHARVTQPRQRWPRCPELLWTTWLLGEAVRGNAPDWALRAHCYLGVLYAALLNTLAPSAAKQPEPPPVVELAEHVDRLMSANLADPPSLEAIATQLSMSVRHLTRRYRLLTGLSVHERLETFRLERAAHLLTTTSLSIAEVAQTVGLNCASYFTRRFRARFGAAPSAFRRQG